MKHTCTLLFLLTCSSISFAQILYGLKGGVHLSDIAITNYINPDVEEDYSLKAGIHGGIFLSADVAEKVRLSSELQYSKRGVNAIENINLHYISLSLLPQYRFADRFWIEFGPELGYLVSATSKYGNVSNVWNNKLDIGLDAGVQTEVSDKITVGIRYYAGFSSVIDAGESRDINNNPTGETIKYQNTALQLSIYFTIGRKDFE
ncbi:porin family protein [Chryseosolibacter indicus]|uniref:Outer membrane beta-barrel protein n=1 Tax=Chryseosolibacter indicus TaxID=2782351 RepID=A0ABS5VQS7_9BACT|nr:porin family protein [Chryseosolibacter indicus]MBT1703358.1 outer membrane beta-barrel protein [Chryseosolibacter indicus]